MIYSTNHIIITFFWFLFPIILYKYLEYYCEVCDEAIRTKSKRKHFQSLTHLEFEKRIRTKHTIQNTNFFDIDEKFTEYLTNSNKKVESYLVKYDSKLIFDKEFSPPIKSEIEINLTEFHLKRFLILWIEKFSERG